VNSTITGADWKRTMIAAKGWNNLVLEQIKAKIAKQKKP
jgi:hypothetical protein